MDEQSSKAAVTWRRLWREFIPLSLSDVTMALGDPLIAATIAHLPEARLNLGALGVGKGVAVCFESPIIMLLHASNALAGHRASRKALFRFMLSLCAILTLLLLVVALPPVFAWISKDGLGLEADLVQPSWMVLMLLILWPAIIGWRRYFQGLLIYGGHVQPIGKASVVRLLVVGIILSLGFYYQLSGEKLAGLALLGGIVVESALVTWAAFRLGLAKGGLDIGETSLPSSFKEVAKFYWPLANSMMLVWGGRLLLLSVIARADDASIALAAWPAAWSVVLVIANATRMVQQLTIRYRHEVDLNLLLYFTVSVGAIFTLSLLGLVFTPLGTSVLKVFVANDASLLAAVQPVVLYCAFIPLLVALQNTFQGVLIQAKKTGSVNIATFCGTLLLLGLTAVFVNEGMQGASAAALAMLLALGVETIWLSKGIWAIYSQKREEKLSIG